MHLHLVLCFVCFFMCLFGCFSVLFIFVFHKNNFFFEKLKNTKTVYVYIGTCVPWMAIETKFSKFYILCSLDEHLNAQLSK